MDRTNANMRMAIITSDSYFSCLLISDLVKYHHDNIACIVITPSKVKGKSTLGSVLHVYKKTGFRNLVYKVVAGLWVYFAEALYMRFAPATGVFSYTANATTHATKVSPRTSHHHFLVRASISLNSMELFRCHCD